MADGTTHDLIIVATAKNIVYAFDANTYQLLWPATPASFAPPGPESTDFMTPLFLSDPGSNTGGDLLGDVHKGMGILATPVIDRARNRLYVSYRTINATTNAREHHIAAMSLADGSFIPGLDHNITSGTIGNDGCCSGKELCGDVRGVIQRASLLLSNDTVYLAFAAYTESVVDWAGNPQHRFRGQLLAFDVTTMNPMGTFTSVSPGNTGTRMGGGIWQAATGPAADSNGDVYLSVGNAMTF